MILICLIVISCVLYMKKIAKKKKSTMQIYILKDVTGNKKTWKTAKSCFSEKPKISEKIFLIQNSQK